MASHVETPPSTGAIAQVAHVAQHDAKLPIEYVRVKGKRISSIRKIRLNGHLCYVHHIVNLYSRGDRHAIYGRSTLLRENVKEYPFHIFVVELKYDFWIFIVPRENLRTSFDGTEQDRIDTFIRIDAGRDKRQIKTFDFSPYLNAWDLLRRAPAEQAA